MSMTLVKDLRDRTGAGMMDCKKALDECGSDIDAAIEWLRKQGIAKAAKKASRTAKEGIVSTCSTADHTLHALVEFNCETDFVVKTDEYQLCATELAALAAASKATDLAAFTAQAFRGETVGAVMTNLTAKIGENIGVSRVTTLVAGPQEKIGKYIHAGSKIAVLVRFKDPSGKLTDDMAKDIAMHVAAMNPHYIRRSDVSADVVEREKEIIKAQLVDEKKPANILDKIVDGRVSKFYGDVCLEEQVFVKDPQGKQTVAAALKGVSADITITEVVRWQVGEKVVEAAAEEAA